MFKVFYYYYYLFYTKVLVHPQAEPHLVTTLALSFVESLLINGIIDFIAVRFFCCSIGKWPMITVLVLILAGNYMFYHKSGKAKKIAKDKPKFYGNHRLSVIIVLVISLIVVSWLFWGAVYGKYLLEKCH